MVKDLRKEVVHEKKWNDHITFTRKYEDNKINGFENINYCKFRAVKY